MPEVCGLPLLNPDEKTDQYADEFPQRFCTRTPHPDGVHWSTASEGLRWTYTMCWARTIEENLILGPMPRRCVRPIGHTLSAQDRETGHA